jgi:hypothetical protein
MEIQPVVANLWNDAIASINIQSYVGIIKLLLSRTRPYIVPCEVTATHDLFIYCAPLCISIQTNSLVVFLICLY